MMNIEPHLVNETRYNMFYSLTNIKTDSHAETVSQVGGWIIKQM